jgi:thymidylate synthase ThyX
MMAKGDNPYVQKDERGYNITPEGRTKLDNVLTNSQDNVYAFTGEESPVMVAAAMARLSRRGDDMRITYLDEFAGSAEDADKLLNRVITAYGDDSVQQLVGIHVVVENASNLLTKLLEWGRLAAYLEQSTRYIFFDQKDAQGKYKYFTPTNLSKDLTTEYDQAMDQIFDLYSKIVRGLTEHVRNNNPEPSDKLERTAWLGATRAQACDAARPVLPVATKSTVGIFASGQALDSLIMHLMSEDLEEAHYVGKQILEESRKVVPAFLERTDIPERGGATTAYRANIRQAVADLAKANDFTKPQPSKSNVELLSYWPENELELVPEILFEQSHLPISELRKRVGEWDDKKKETILEAAIGERLNRRHKPGRAFEFPHYEFEITDDYGTFRDLQRHRIVDAFEWQQLTPAYGYDIPELVTEAGFEADFVKCFEIAEQLYRRLQEAGFMPESQYATLLGHKMRYRFMLNARAAFHFLELRTSPQGHPGYRAICHKMYELLKEVHPRIAGAMKFVNQGEDPELTRMAAEVATQYKLQKLDK